MRRSKNTVTILGTGDPGGITARRVGPSRRGGGSGLVDGAGGLVRALNPFAALADALTVWLDHLHQLEVIRAETQVRLETLRKLGEMWEGELLRHAEAQEEWRRQQAGLREMASKAHAVLLAPDSTDAQRQEARFLFQSAMNQQLEINSQMQEGLDQLSHCSAALLSDASVPRLGRPDDDD